MNHQKRTTVVGEAMMGVVWEARWRRNRHWHRPWRIGSLGIWQSPCHHQSLQIQGCKGVSRLEGCAGSSKRLWPNNMVEVQKIGSLKSRGDFHHERDYHSIATAVKKGHFADGAAHKWNFAKSTQEVLLQQHGYDKDSWSWLWNISSTGLISAGESSFTTALREFQEGFELTRLTHSDYKVLVFIASLAAIMDDIFCLKSQHSNSPFRGWLRGHIEGQTRERIHDYFVFDPGGNNDVLAFSLSNIFPKQIPSRLHWIFEEGGWFTAKMLLLLVVGIDEGPWDPCGSYNASRITCSLCFKQWDPGITLYSGYVALTRSSP